MINLDQQPTKTVQSPNTTSQSVPKGSIERRSYGLRVDGRSESSGRRLTADAAGEMASERVEPNTCSVTRYSMLLLRDTEPSTASHQSLPPACDASTVEYVDQLHAGRRRHAHDVTPQLARARCMVHWRHVPSAQVTTRLFE